MDVEEDPAAKNHHSMGLSIACAMQYSIFAGAMHYAQMQYAQVQYVYAQVQYAQMQYAQAQYAYAQTQRSMRRRNAVCAGAVQYAQGQCSMCRGSAICAVAMQYAQGQYAQMQFMPERRLLRPPAPGSTSFARRRRAQGLHLRQLKFEFYIFSPRSAWCYFPLAPLGNPYSCGRCSSMAAGRSSACAA